MDNACHGGTSAVVDVGHRACYGSRSGYAAEDGRHEVGHALTYQFSIGIVMVAYDTVGHRSRQQALDGTEHGNGDGRTDQTFERLPRQFRHDGTRQLGTDAEAVADGLDGADAGILL